MILNINTGIVGRFDKIQTNIQMSEFANSIQPRSRY